MSSLPANPQNDVRDSSAWSRRAFALGIFVVLLALALALQWRSGAYQSEFGAHPDEASHYVTGLMIRDYVAAGFPGNPMRFAQAYYERLPKVALGHYPPGFYAFEGLWFLLISDQRPSVLVFMAVQSALVALIVFLAAAPRFGRIPALSGAVICILLPLTQQFASTVMSDLMLAMFSLLAALAFARYLESGRALDSAAFGLFASMAIMTKGSGLFLAGVPPLALALSGQFRRLGEAKFWLSVPIVAVLCGPWTYYSYGIAKEGWAHEPFWAFLKTALPYFTWQCIQTQGFILVMAACVGIVNGVLESRGKGRFLCPFLSVIVASPIVLIGFYCVVPAGLEPRYVLPVAPFVIILAVAGISAMATRLPPGLLRKPHLVPVGFALVLLVCFLLEKFTIPQKRIAGFAPLALELAAEGVHPSEEMLISSDARGEGAFVAEVAMHLRQSGCIIRRASKWLATSDWMGRGYTLKFANAQELSDYLQTAPVNRIVLDGTVPEGFQTPHHLLLENTLTTIPGAFQLEHAYPAHRAEASAGEIRVYRRLTKP